MNTTRQPIRERLQAITDALMNAWRAAGTLDAAGVVVEGGQERRIGADGYDAPERQECNVPDEWRGDTDGWQLIARLR